MDCINPDALYSPKQVSQLENVSLATVYLRLGLAEYAALKDAGKTKILGSAILARRRAKLRPAQFKAPPPAPPSRFHTIKQKS